jgi:hypothetical protein
MNDVALAVSPDAIHYSRGRDKYDNAPAQEIASDFDEFEVAVLADISERKGLAYICAPLATGRHCSKPGDFPGENHWRLKDYVQSRRFIAFDFDGFADVASFEATLSHLTKYKGFGYTTASHTPQAPRARAVVELSRMVTRAEAIALCAALQSEMRSVIGDDAIVFDESVYRGEQPVYTPVTTSNIFHFGGAPVDVSAVLAQIPQAPADASASQTTRSKSLNAILDSDSFVAPERVADGEGRESTLLQYAGHLRGKGLDQATIERTLLDYNQCHIQPPLDPNAVLDKARRYEQAAALGTAPVSGFSINAIWPDPKDLAESLHPVPNFPLKLLPKEIAEYVKDVSERFSCPLDFPAIAAVVAIGAAIGARVFCRPYADGTWMVPAGAWGMVVSPPSATKSPPLSEMLRPLYLLDKLAADQYKTDIQQYDVLKQIHDNAIKASIKQGQVPVGLIPPMEPAMTRYVVNDSTYEMLVAIAAANPNGFLIWRDELVGWFHSLNKENQKEARGLYLTGWTGTEGYATDRIGRGHVRADRVNLSLLGTIQPNVLRGIVYDAVAGGAGDDGLVARFQLAVYPDPVARYVKVDRAPNRQVMHYYDDLIKRMVTLEPTAIGASFTTNGTPYLPFDSDAQVIFDAWRQALEDRICDVNTEEHPAMLAHLGKYRSLFPKLALILHLSAGGVGPIGRNPALRAKVWTEYLEAHARRVYHTATNRAMQSAVALANKIKANKLSDGFTKSDVLVKEWAGLRSADEVATALTVLKDGSWLTVHEDRSTGGRPAERHYINPKVKRAA